MPKRTRALHRPPRTNTRVTKRMTVRDSIGNVLADGATTIAYNVGTCPGATVSNPHDRASNPEGCDYCYITTV